MPPGPRGWALAAGSLPAILDRAGPGARLAADEFFRAQLGNPHTWAACSRWVLRFLAWCEARDVELARITPGWRRPESRIGGGRGSVFSAGRLEGLRRGAGRNGALPARPGRARPPPLPTS